MGSRYYNITAEEMAQFLEPQGFIRMTLDGVVELMWGRVIQHEGRKFCIRVYSGINPSGESRDVGKDAIRVEVYYRDRDGEIVRVGGSKRVHRVKTWQKNLQDRIVHWVEALGPNCPKCQSPMVLRKAKKGANAGREFYSCSSYRHYRENNCGGFIWKDEA